MRPAPFALAVAVAFVLLGTAGTAHASLRPTSTANLSVGTTFNLWYNVTGSTINFVFSCSCSKCDNGYCSVGFGSDPNMPNKDTYTGWFSGSTVVLIDEYSPDNRQPRFDSTQNINNVQGEKLTNRLTFAFSRPLNTGDNKDYTFSLAGPTSIVFAYSNSAVGAVGVGRFYFIICVIKTFSISGFGFRSKLLLQ
jgi:hypothetical protein